MKARERKKREPITVTKLARFMNEHKLKPLNVAREAEISRQHLLRLRKGAMQPTIAMATHIRDACGRLLKRRLKMSDLFEV
ncbi:MAG TPA: hypothetical protein VGQ21_02000 [Thermoanaerobaculia bacterium]|jgi:hypothetical protein|nr:hypothetical protein [Thermoanaerobaculia bacterium]